MANAIDLQVASKQLEETLNVAEAKCAKQLGRRRAEAEKYIAEAKGLEADLKTLQADIDIAVHGMSMNVSLLHKTISGTAYIKARCWWHGRQREVQVGTIPAVLERIKTLAADAKVPAADIGWDALKDNTEIVKIIKRMAREKLRHYIVRRLGAAYQAVNMKAAEPVSEIEFVEAELASAVEQSDDADWYAQWGVANQNMQQPV